MNSIAAYLLESGFCLLVFFVFYQALLRRETFYQLNRAFLLFAVSFSILIPLLKISMISRGDIALIPVMLEAVTVSAHKGYFAPSGGPALVSLIPALYLLIAGVLAIRMLLNLRRINLLYNMWRTAKNKG